MSKNKDIFPWQQKLKPAKESTKTYSPVEVTSISNIPPPLAKLRCWVCWGPRGGSEKTPINPNTGLAAKSTASNTWGTIGEALARYLNYGKKEKLNGIGFVFSPEHPFTGIDLDNCRNPQTGALTPESEALIQKIDSYSEASPSGAGVHIIVEAKIPKGRKKATIEMYSEARFFCFTGQPVWKNMNVEKRQKQTLELYEQAFGKEEPQLPPLQTTSNDPIFESVRSIPDGELLTLIARNEKHFTELMQGDTSSLTKDKSGSSADYNLCILLGRYTRLDAPRVDHIFRTSALYRQKWDRRDGTHGTYGERTMRAAFAEIRKKKQSLFDPAQVNGTGPRRLSDGTNTDKFIALTGNSFAWVPHWNTWLQWNGIYWQRGADDEVFKEIRRVPDELWAEWRENKDYKELGVWAKKSDDYFRQLNIERWARRRLSMRSETLDQHPELLACKNGVVDLRTGMLRAGERTDYMTRGVEWAYLPEAACPAFEQFLDDIMQSDETMIAYLWRVIGYCLTGETAARAFFILYGTGKNGKSTFARAVQTLLGMRAENYAQTARFETFLQAKRFGPGADPDIAALAGARLVVASEVNPGEQYRLDGGKIKQMTGEDWMRARFLYSSDFQFLPVCKIFLLVNDVPHIDDNSQALYDRLHYISFNYRIPEEKQDGMLHWRLVGEMEGILAKAVRAAGEWYVNQSLLAPERILKARGELATEMDWLADFWHDCCVVGKECEVVHAALYAEYLKWCEQNKVKRPMQSQTLSKSLRKRGYKKFENVKQQVCWQGIGLRDPFTQQGLREPGEDTEAI